MHRRFSLQRHKPCERVRGARRRCAHRRKDLKARLKKIKPPTATVHTPLPELTFSAWLN